MLTQSPVCPGSRRGLPQREFVVSFGYRDQEVLGKIEKFLESTRREVRLPEDIKFDVRSSSRGYTPYKVRGLCSRIQAIFSWHR